MNDTCNPLNLARGAYLVAGRLIKFTLALVWVVWSLLSMMGGVLIALSHMPNIHPVQLSLLQYGLLFAGLVSAIPLYRRIARNGGQREARGIFLVILALPLLFGYVGYLFRHAPAGFTDSFGMFFWPTGVDVTTRLGLLPVQLIAGAVLLVLGFKTVELTIHGAKALCVLGNESRSRG